MEGYSRYNQEKFVPRDDSEFKIDTHASYHGLTLKTVTEGAAPNKFLVNHSLFLSFKIKLFLFSVSNKSIDSKTDCCFE